MRFTDDLHERFHPRYRDTLVCVTGGAGFIGGWLVEALLELGSRVVVIDDLSTGNESLIPEFIDKHGGRCQFVEGSILDPAALRDAMASARIVFHLAAQTSAPRSIEDPARTFEVNASGTLRVAEAGRRARVERLVSISSAAVYGDGTAPMRESAPPRPLSPYAASKVAAEAIVAAWAHSMGLPGMSLRLFNVYGPRQRAEGSYSTVIPAFARRLLAGKPPVIHGDGSQTRDFVHVRDVVTAILLAGAAELEPRGEAINTGSGHAVSIDELARIMAGLARNRGVQQAPSEARPQSAPARPGDPAHSVADLSLARALLGFEPGISLEDGLADTIAWFAGARPQAV